MNKQVLPLEHNFKAASGNNKPPAIIMLHGYGSDENDLFSFASELPEKYAVFSLKAPLPMQPYGNAWYSIYFDAGSGKFNNTEEAIESRDLVLKCIDEIIAKYEIDNENITLLGFSQGTILSFSIAMSYPNRIKNVIGLSGYIDEEMFIKDYRKNDFSNLNIYTSHGSVDQVIPIDWARKTEPFLNELKIPCTYSEFPVGHGVAPQNFYELKTWLESH